MDIFHNLILGFQVASSWENLLFCFIGTLIGTLIGVLPGIGPTTGVAILIPVTFGMNATTAIITMAGVYYGAMYGGSTTSILINLSRGVRLGHDHARRLSDGQKRKAGTGAGDGAPWPRSSREPLRS